MDWPHDSASIVSVFRVAVDYWHIRMFDELVAQLVVVHVREDVMVASTRSESLIAKKADFSEFKRCLSASNAAHVRIYVMARLNTRWTKGGLL